MKYNIWVFIWDTSEMTKIPLGRFAPYVFGKMIKAKGVKSGLLERNS